VILFCGAGPCFGLSSLIVLVSKSYN